MTLAEAKELAVKLIQNPNGDVLRPIDTDEAGTYDPEQAHIAEDRLLWFIVRRVADRTSPHDETMWLAKTMLQIYELDRTRWCA